MQDESWRLRCPLERVLLPIAEKMREHERGPGQVRKGQVLVPNGLIMVRVST